MGVNIADEKILYSKLLSSLFCSTSIIALSILCLLNNLSFDVYSACYLLKVVMPASFCFWFLGYAIGKILDDGKNAKNLAKKASLKADNAAYEIPSMFGSDAEQVDDEFGEV